MRDFLVVGGGIAGCSAAARLAPLGDTLLLEAEDALGYHASGRSAAMFVENYGPPSTQALTRASRAHHEAAGALSPRGVLMAALAGEARAFEESRDALAMEEIGLDAARALVPILSPGIARAALRGEDLDIDADLLLQGFARAAREAGAGIETRARVSAIRRDAGGWIAETASGTREGRVLVNAAGAWADEVAEMAGVAPLGLVPMRRSVARIPAPGGLDVSGWPMLFGPGETWYAKPDAGRLIVSPAEETPVQPHDAYAEDLTLAEGIARYEAHVSEPVTRVEHSWAGLRTFTPDRALAIGFARDEPSFLWLAGQGGYGLQSAPAASRLAADLVAGRSPELDADTVGALDPARFGSG